jgi:hypothetical protein
VAGNLTAAVVELPVTGSCTDAAVEGIRVAFAHTDYNTADCSFFFSIFISHKSLLLIV